MKQGNQVVLTFALTIVAADVPVVNESDKYN